MTFAVRRSHVPDVIATLGNERVLLFDVAPGNPRPSSRSPSALAFATVACACRAGSTSNRKARGLRRPRTECCGCAEQNHFLFSQPQCRPGHRNARRNISWSSEEHTSELQSHSDLV